MKILNFRIDTALKEKLAIVKNYFFPNQNLSDVARYYLNKGISQSTLNQSSSIDPDIVVIARKVELSATLSYREVEYLCSCVHNAYSCSRDIYSLFRIRFIIDILMTFKAVLELIKLTPDEISYFQRKLCGYDNTILETVTNHISKLENQQPEERNTGFYQCYVDALSVLMRDLKDKVNISLLNQVLKPYLFNLVTVAKYYMRLQDNSPSFHYLDSECFLRDHFGVTTNVISETTCYHPFRKSHFLILVKRGIQFECTLYAHHGNYSVHFDFSVFEQYINLFDSLNCLSDIKGNIYSTKDLFIERRFGQDGYRLGYQKSSFYITNEDYSNLSSLFFKIRDTYPQAITELEFQWGII